MVALAEDFRASERHLWGLCFRMTGCAADADDLVQETFARAVERPPPDRDRSLRPWLVKVAMNLSRDLLRRRRRRGYVGPYLPGAVEAAAVDQRLLEQGAVEPVAYESASTAGRYDLLESVSLAFLVALEALTPQKRAVLLLRDVFDYSVRETATALGMSEPNVKTTLHRARRQMADYDARRRPVPVLAERSQAMLERLFAGLAAGDTEAVAELLADDVRALSDGAGVYHAALKPILGRDKVMRFMLGILGQRGLPTAVALQALNGAPAMVASWAEVERGFAPVVVMWVDVDDDGRVSRIYSQLAPRKLTAVSPPG